MIGFSNDAGDGIVGLEAYYDTQLKGTNGRVFGYLNENQEYEKKTIAPENGYTLQTTLDINIQEIVEKYIAEFDETYGKTMMTARQSTAQRISASSSWIRTRGAYCRWRQTQDLI